MLVSGFLVEIEGREYLDLLPSRVNKSTIVSTVRYFQIESKFRLV